MNKSDFEKIIPKKYLKDGAMVEEGDKDAKLRSVTITGIKNPFQVIIDDGKGAFTRFLKSGDDADGIQKVCDSILFYEVGNTLQPIFIELKSSADFNKEVRQKMKGTGAVFHYYLRILRSFYNPGEKEIKPYCLFLYYRDRDRKRAKPEKGTQLDYGNGKIYKYPMTDGRKISLRRILSG